MPLRSACSVSPAMNSSATCRLNAALCDRCFVMASILRKPSRGVNSYCPICPLQGAHSTRRRTSPSTPSSMRTCAPLGRRTSIAPSPPRSAGHAANLARLPSRRRQRRRPPLRRDQADRTNLGVSLAFRDELVAAGAPSPAPRRSSGQPSRERPIHLKTRFALTPFARATPATDAPGLRARRRSADAPPRSKTAASSARRPQPRAQPRLIPLPSSSGVHQIAGGHFTDANGIS